MCPQSMSEWIYRKSVCIKYVEIHIKIKPFCIKWRTEKWFQKTVDKGKDSIIF